MPILNYTTSIAAEKTTAEIQKILAKAGAKSILTDYDDDNVLSAISFQILLNGQRLSFLLPAKIDSIYAVLMRDPDVPRRFRNREQASRVCWRIIKDWIQAQLALVEAEQAKVTEVFLPYAQDQSGQTLYQKLEESEFRGLLGYESDG